MRRFPGFVVISRYAEGWVSHGTCGETIQDIGVADSRDDIIQCWSAWGVWI